ncbi:hypothetical protein [Tenacibaculum ovolyticum]|uniref:hypothetical protein n=1 Tax=Tenacibaculum ovolyticum TaxID=104270 RepID=UPI00048D189D|nr:hypothetical protein [Tenacibaculum ovolyticum]
MKKYYFGLILILYFGCKNSSINSMENTLGFILPKNYIILKDTIEGNIDYIVSIEVKLKNKRDSKQLINKLEKEYTLKNIKNGYSLKVESNDYNFYPCIFSIDTLNNTLLFKEFHY